MIVALLVSAWIEINIVAHEMTEHWVALLVSAWIEISSLVRSSTFTQVALLVSAWIEIKELGIDYHLVASHSS